MFCNRLDFEYCNFIFPACNFHESLAIIRFLKNCVLFLTDRIKLKLKLKIIRFRVQSSIQEPLFPGPITLRLLTKYRIFFGSVVLNYPDHIKQFQVLAVSELQNYCIYHAVST